MRISTPILAVMGGGALLAAFWGCGFFQDPEDIALYSNDTVTVYKITVFETTFVDSPRVMKRRDTLSTVRFANPADESIADSFHYTVKDWSWNVRPVRLQPTVRESLLVLRLNLGTDRHPKDPPDTVGKTAYTELKNLPDIPALDSMVLDTVTFTFKYIPYVPLLPVNTLLHYDFVFPDSVSQSIALRNPGHAAIVAEATWGRPRLSPDHDSLYLVWRMDSSGVLGVRHGYNNLYYIDTTQSDDAPFIAQRVFKNLTPPGESRSAYWRIGDSASGFSENGKVFTLTTGTRVVPPKIVFDTVVSVHSRFRLKGDFQMEFSIRRAAKDSAGYSVAAFVSTDSNPTFVFDPILREFLVLAQQAGHAGLAMTLKNGVAPLKSYGFFGSSVSDPRLKASQYAKFSFRRDSASISFWMRDLEPPSAERMLQSFNYEAGTMPDQVYLHFAMGNFQSLGSSYVEWSDFAITQGEIVR